MDKLRNVLIAALALALVVGTAGCPRMGQGEGVGTELIPPTPPVPPIVEQPTGEMPASLAQALKGRQVCSSCGMAMTNAAGDKMVYLVQLTDGKPVRMKLQVEKGWMLIDLQEDCLYIYDTAKNVALKAPLEKKGGQTEGPPSMSAEEFSQEVPVLASEAIDGAPCWVVETVQPGETEKTKVWFDKQYGLVRQTRKQEATVSFAYTRINEIGEDEFKLPLGAEVVDVGDIKL